MVGYCEGFRFNAARAYREVYDPEMTPPVAAACACKLLTNANIRNAVKIQMEHQLANKDELAQRIVAEHTKIAFTDGPVGVEQVTAFGYTVKTLDEIPEEQRAVIAGVEKTETGLLKVKVYDKQKSLDSLSRILGLFDDNARKPGEKYEDLITSYHKGKENADRT